MIAFNNVDSGDEEGHGSEECERERMMEERREERRGGREWRIDDNVAWILYNSERDVRPYPE